MQWNCWFQPLTLEPSSHPGQHEPIGLWGARAAFTVSQPTLVWWSRPQRWASSYFPAALGWRWTQRQWQQLQWRHVHDSMTPPHLTASRAEKSKQNRVFMKSLAGHVMSFHTSESLFPKLVISPSTPQKSVATSLPALILHPNRRPGGPNHLRMATLVYQQLFCIPPAKNITHYQVCLKSIHQEKQSTVNEKLLTRCSLCQDEGSSPQSLVFSAHCHHLAVSCLSTWRRPWHHQLLPVSRQPAPPDACHSSNNKTFNWLPEGPSLAFVFQLASVHTLTIFTKETWDDDWAENGKTQVCLAPFKRAQNVAPRSFLSGTTYVTKFSTTTWLKVGDLLVPISVLSGNFFPVALLIAKSAIWFSNKPENLHCEIPCKSCQKTSALQTDIRQKDS